jgi:hypothetical protein
MGTVARRQSRERNNLVTAWIQDWNDGVVVGSSFDGGKTWTRTVPNTTACTWSLNGSTPTADYTDFAQYTSVNDPRVSFGPAPTGQGSIAYLGSYVLGNSPFSSAIVNRSLDGGKTWTDPVVLDRESAPLVLDAPSIVADPNRARAGYAYATWSKSDALNFARNQYGAFTTDGGETWSPLPLIPASPGHISMSELQVLPDGSLLAVITEVPTPTDGSLRGPTTFLARRLENPTEPGSTWSDPVVVADPADPNLVAIPRSAVAPATFAPNGTAYVSWQIADANRSTLSLMYSKSTNGGRTWTPPYRIGSAITGPPETGNNGTSSAPNIAVASDGKVAVAFYDHRKYSGNTPPKVTDFWLRQSSDGGKKWSETHLAGPFDQTTAAPTDSATRGLIGDSQGIVPLSRGVGIAFTLAEPFVQNQCTRLTSLEPATPTSSSTA